MTNECVLCPFHFKCDELFKLALLYIVDLERVTCYKANLRQKIDRVKQPINETIKQQRIV